MVLPAVRVGAAAAAGFTHFPVQISAAAAVGMEADVIMKRKKICFVVAVPGTAQSFLKEHIKCLSKSYDIYLVADAQSPEQTEGLEIASCKSIRILRGISVGGDLKALIKLTRYFRKEKFDAVHSVTPKAGLLTAIAGKMANVPVRTHIFTGQVWATRQGAMRRMLKAFDRVIVRLNTEILVDGKAQRDFLIKEKILKEGRAAVLGAGSIAGVNTRRFVPEASVRERLRQEYGLGEKMVFAFMGRLNRDKGVYELMEAFNRLVSEREGLYLVLFGIDEENCVTHLPEYSNITEGENFRYFGPTREPEKMLQMADAFVLPTYREGFGCSVIEAQCLGLPVICSDTYGVMDAMVDDVTGLRCKVGDVETLYQAMKRMVDEGKLRKAMGAAGRERILSEFSSEVLTAAWEDFYREKLQ